MSRLLLVDDDVELCQMLSEYLSTEGFDVDVLNDGSNAVAAILSDHYDAVVLDVMLPGMSGFDILRQVRTQSLVPVLMLTARGNDTDSVVGLELGADDYLAKPCNPRVLVARLRAVLRRSEALSSDSDKTLTTLSIGDLEMNAGARTIYRGGVALALTSTEYRVLEILLRNAGKVVEKTELSEQALGRKLKRYDRSLDMHVSNLRKRLGPLPSGDERIKTVRGVGYQYVSVGN